MRNTFSGSYCCFTAARAPEAVPHGSASRTPSRTRVGATAPRHLWRARQATCMQTIRPMPDDLTALSARAAVAAAPGRRRLAARDGRGGARPDRGCGRPAERPSNPLRRAGAGPCRRGGSPIGIVGIADRREGPDRGRGRPYHPRIADLRRQRAGALRHRRRAPRGARRRRGRQVEHAGVRGRRPDLQRGVRPDPKPVGHEPDVRRVLGRARRSRSPPGRSGSRPAPTSAAACARRRRSARSWACGRRRDGLRAGRPSSRSTR